MHDCNIIIKVLCIFNIKMTNTVKLFNKRERERERERENFCFIKTPKLIKLYILIFYIIIHYTKIFIFI
jgi:hypothetical protein